jgi:glyoxylase-like metal-dependent hydrolase (beta-lactamase superfamily II)
MRQKRTYSGEILPLRWRVLKRDMSFPSSKLHLMCIVSSLLFLGVVGSARFANSQQAQTRGRQNGVSNPAGEDQKAKGGDIELLPVQGNVSMVVGAGGNITVQAGRDGIVLVDTGLATMSDKVLQLIRPLSKGQITYIINTDDRSDHVGGNESFAKSGRPLAIDRASGASVMIVAFNTVLDRMSAPTGQAAPTPEKAWPNDTYSTPQKNLYFNGEPIQVFHQPATTDGNSFVVFRHSDVISTGDLFDPTQYPIIDLKSGGSLQAVIDGLYRLKQMAIPADHQEGGTMLVPGHGRICDVADLAVYHQMMVIIRDRLQDMIKQGMTLEQIKAAKPTRDYDPIYGSDTVSWTTDMFVEAAYKSLTAKAAPNSSRKAN